MIKSYTKKPVTIQAVQFEDKTGEIHEFCGDKVREPVGKEFLVIETLEGDMRASKGDFIIKGVNGEFYPCKPDIFEKTYCEEGCYQTKGLSFGHAFELLKHGAFPYMWLPQWSSDVKIRIKRDGEMSAPYLYVESRFGTVPWKETMIELFSDDWEVGLDD